MKHLIQRAGREYGPYSIEEIRGYVDQGNIITTDLAREEASDSWIPVSDVLTVVQPFPPVVPQPPVAVRDAYYVFREGKEFGPYSMEQLRLYLAQGSLQSADPVRKAEQQSWTTFDLLVPPPPSLHWGIVFLLVSITYGVFSPVWLFVQAAWAKKINPQSKATRYFTIAMILAFLTVCVFGMYSSTLSAPVAGNAEGAAPDAAAGSTMWLLILVVTSFGGGAFMFAGVFNIRKSMVTYYNTVEPIGLRMSRAMTFFFHVVYLQYHMTRIARWKKTGVRP
jgi:hypothetical protein